MESILTHGIFREKENLEVVLYHGSEGGPCPDGIGAAFGVIYNHPNRENIITEGISHNVPPKTDLAGKVVILVDICPEKEIIEKIIEDAKWVHILDHHASSFNLLPQFDDRRNLSYYIDNHLSAAQLAWDFYQRGDSISHDRLITKEKSYNFDCYTFANNGNREYGKFEGKFVRPWFIEIIADRDLWKFSIPYSKQISSGMFSTWNYNFEKFDELMKLSDKETISKIQDYITIGSEKMKLDENELNRAVKRVIPVKMKWGDNEYTIGASDVPYHLRSEAGNRISEDKNPDGTYKYDFAMIYHYDPREDQWWISLRGNKECTIPLDKICLSYGGGGHQKACGFVIHGPRSTANVVVSGDFNTLFEVL